MKKETYKCMICNKPYSTLSHLSRHVSQFHENKKLYYDTYMKKEGEGFCAECGLPTSYTDSWQHGYLKYCSKKCKKIGVAKSLEKSSLEIYGETNPNKTKKVRNRIKKTNKKRYGNSCPMQNSQIQQNIREKNLKNLGVELPFQSQKIQKKGAKTRKELYGFEYTYQSSELYDKCKSTMIKRYDVEYPSQSEILFNKGQKSALILKKYKNSGIYYQGSYELDFLEKYDPQFDIQRASFIKYSFEKIQKIYYPDFLIPSLNLIVEIKNQYLVKRDRDKIEAKKRATISMGFNFIMIINKNYEEFEKLISQVVL